MTSSRLETHRQTILHFLNEGVCNAQEIHKLTNIPLSTIKYNIKKLKENGNEKKRRLHQPQQGFSVNIYSKKSYSVVEKFSCKTF